MKKTLLITALLIGLAFTSCEKDKFNGTACFTYAPTTDIKVNDTITFTNCSENAAHFAWSFGDHHHGSTDENPTYSYSQAGTYKVRLAVQDLEFKDINGDMVINADDRYPSESDIMEVTITVSE